MENNKYKKIIIILSVILVVLLLAFGGLYLYRKFVVLKGIDRTSVPIQHGSVDNNKKEEKVVLNEEDVKNWLNAHKLADLYFILNGNDFDITSADNSFYSNFLGFNLLFGGLYQNAVENITLNNDKNYNYQYTYTITFIKNLLNDYFNVGIDKININTMNESFKGTANFSMNNDLFTVKVAATGLDNSTGEKINKIYLNMDNNVVVKYDLLLHFDLNNEEKIINQREIVLKKTDNGYNIIKAYKVES